MRYLYVITVSIFFMFPVIGFSDTIIVPDDYPKIQQAINAAKNGDTVIVKPDTYVENIDFKGKAITVKSEQGPESTVIDGGNNGSVCVFVSGEGNDSVLEGFTLTNGSGTYYNSQYCGGGVYCNHSGPRILGNHIIYNTALDEGGGFFCVAFTPQKVEIRGNVIAGNMAFLVAGGLYCGGDVEYLIADNIICNNKANYFLWPSSGGGIYLWYTPKATVVNNIIHDNYAGMGGGGGIMIYDSATDITNNTICRNETLYQGGGIYYDAFPFTGRYITITNNIVRDNKAHDKYDEIYSYLSATHCNVKGGFPGWGNIDADPLYVDEVNDDFHLTYPSPCKDTGDNSAVTELYDFEGDPRIAYGTVDMGADEFYTHLYWTGDAAPGGNVELKFVGLPGTTPIQLWLGSGIMDPPMATKYGDWYLQFPLLANVGLGSIPSPEGVLVFPFTFPANTPTPLVLPFQAGIGMELSNLSVMEVR